MGDYTKVIVNCSVEKIEDSNIKAWKEEFLEKAYMCTSAYHCGGELFEIGNHWHHRSDISFITQLKWGDGLEGFVDWLQPQVIQGSGERNVFCMSFTEYQSEPTLYFMDRGVDNE